MVFGLVLLYIPKCKDDSFTLAKNMENALQLKEMQNIFSYCLSYAGCTETYAIIITVINCFDLQNYTIHNVLQLNSWLINLQVFIL